MGSPAPAQSMDSGLAGLSLIAGYYRIAADPAQLSHQLALTGRGDRGRGYRSRRQSSSAEIAHPAGRDRQASGRHSLSGDPAAEGGRLRGPGRRLRQGGGEAGRSDRQDRARPVDRGHRRAVLRRTGADHATAGRGGRRSEDLRLPLVLAFDRALPALARPCADRFAVRAIVRPGDADLLPARRRQGAGSQGHVDADRADRRHGDAGSVRDGPAVPAHLYAEPHDKPDGCRTRPAAVPSSLPSAARLFRDPAGRADGGAHARARDDPGLSDRAGPDIAA